jgi:aryl-alcohol dehydrogenase-like predicted oxidoreductase
MQYRTLGRSGLRLSEIGFGCGNIGGLMVRASLEERIKAVTRAMDLGIDYFDTAPAYGNGQSEIHLGDVLSRIKRPVHVATKVGLGPADLKDIESAVQRSVETSLQRLQRDSLDVLQLHTAVLAGDGRGINLRDVLGAGGVAETFEKLRSRKLVRFLGFSGLGDISALLKVVESQRFDVVQVYYNLLNPSAGMAVPSNFSGQDFRLLLDKAVGHGMGVVVIRVLAGGALGGDIARSGYASPGVGPSLVPGNEYQADLKRAGQLGFLLQGGVNNLSQAGIRFALNKPGVSTVLVGFSSLEQIEEAASCSARGPLPQPVIERLREVWSADFNQDYSS